MPLEKPFLAYSTNPATRYGGGFSPDGDPGVPFWDRRFAAPELGGMLALPGPYTPAKGKIPATRYGERLSDKDWAMLPNPVFRVPANAKRPPAPTLVDITGGINKIVSERARAVIEEMDPDNHQFHPVMVRCSVTQERLQSDMDFFYWNILTWLPPDEVFDLDEMDIPQEVVPIINGRSPDGTVIMKPKTHIVIRDNKSIVVNHAHWMDAMRGRKIALTTGYHTEDRAVLAPYRWIFTSTARRAFKSHRLSGFGFTPMKYASGA